MHSLRKIPFQHFTWIHINHPGHDTVEYLRKKFAFHPLTLQDILSASERTTIHGYTEYIYTVFTFPDYDRNSREVRSIKINIFIGRGFLITIAHGKLKILKSIFEFFYGNNALQNRFSGHSPEKLLYEVLNGLYLESMPIIDHLISDCDYVEKKIFSRKEKRMISKILFIRKNIMDFRKITQGHKDILKKLIQSLTENTLFDMQPTEVYFHDLIDHSKEIWNNLENLKERIDALQQTNESQITFRLSGIMKTLTIISVITFPITLIANIFGMNTLNAMPFVNHPYGFWGVIVIMLLIVATMLTIFRKKGWM